MESKADNISSFEYLFNPSIIIKNPNYIITVLKQLMPFLKKQPFENDFKYEYRIKTFTIQNTSDIF